MKEELNISYGKVGMNKTSNFSSLKESEYAIMINGDVENESGDIFYLTNEPSNLLISRIKEGYKVIGHGESAVENRTYLLITNPLNKVSEIGYIEGINYFNNEEDIQSLCGCDVVTNFTSALENIVQQPIGEYHTIKSDFCNNCLNFNINYPIKTLQIKTEKKGTTLYFADNYNPDRYIQLFDLDKYGQVGVSNCADDNLEDTCLDCNKLLIDPNIIHPTISVINKTDGTLGRGTYYALVAYCDELGNAISEYYSITNPIHLHKVIKSETESQNTDMGFILKVNNLSESDFKYYKIAIIYKNTESEVLYYTTNPLNTNSSIYSVYNIRQLNIAQSSEVNFIKPYYRHSENLSQANGYLFRTGLTVHKEINLQPIANLLGGMLKWATVETTEDIYKSGNIVKYGDFIAYNRFETYPFGFYVTFKGGRSSSVFPFIGRPSNEADTALVIDSEGNVVNDIDTNILSIQNNLNKCDASDRTMFYQYYDTAEVISEFDTTVPPSEDTIEITEEYECVAEAVKTIGTQTIVIPEDVNFSSLGEYIEEYREQIIDPLSTFYNEDIANALTAEYPDSHCTPQVGSNCELDELVSSEIEVGTITNETINAIEIALDDYDGLPYSRYDFYERNEDGDKIIDAGFSIIPPFTYKRITPTNEGCSYAQMLSVGFPSDMYGQYYPGGTEASLLETQTVSCTSSIFNSKLHKGSVWYKINKSGRSKIILQLANQASGSSAPSNYANGEYRISVFESCSSTTTVNTLNNGSALVGCMILNANNSYTIELDLQNITTSTFYIAFDFPIVEENFVFYVCPTEKAISVMTRELEYKNHEVSYDSISFNKREVYKYTCTFDASKSMCEPTPYEYGKFAYTQSTETYPDNEELFNSRKLIINETDLTVEEDKKLFDEFYKSASLEDGTILLKEDTDFRCRNIRHFKFPSNLISPFQSDTNLTFGATPNIYILGVYINKQTVKDFLLIAKNNGLLTEEQYNDIVSFTIVRGNRNNNKSVVAKGLLFDMYEYEEGSKNILFPNFPYNTLGDNHLFDGGIQHSSNSTSNHKFTFHSPETSFFKPSLPNEILVDGYQYGKSNGKFVNVEDHPTWTILSSKAYSVANTLGIAEAAIEFIIHTTNALNQAAQTNWFVLGVSSGGNPIGSVASAIATGLQIASFAANGVLKKGQYSLQWQKTIRDLGQPKNFAYYYTSVGHYNKFAKNKSDYNIIRAINDAVYLKEQKYALSTQTEGVLNINNLDRESSVLISLNEEYSIRYDSDYIDYDNWNSNKNNASRTSLTDTYTCEGIGQTRERTKNIASPYVTIYNYLQNQYGSLYDIEWLNTGKTHLINTEDESEYEIDFGGDTYISRFAIKRKMPIFILDAIGLPPLTPLNYSDHSNLPNATFYCDYELNEDNTNLGRLLFPKISSDYNFDCNTNKGFYKSNKSKFYLSYYGIPSYLVETSINTFLRDRGVNIEDDFYPNVADYTRWTQEKYVPLREDNRYIFNDSYLNTDLQLSTKKKSLPLSFNQELYNKIGDMPNGVIYSQQDISEQDLFDPYLNFKVNNKKDFPTNFGKLIAINSIDNSQVLARFTNKSVVFNAIDSLADRLTKEQSILDMGGIFATRPLEFSSASLGYTGSSSVEIVQNQYGSFWVDAPRGSVFFLPTGAKSGLIEISATKRDGSPSNMKQWFRQHLPFKAIQNNNIIGLNIDNPYNGIGITMGWDAKRERVFITKKDYIIEDDRELCLCNGNYIYHNNKTATISLYTSLGYTFIGEECCKLVFEKEIPKTYEVIETVTTTVPNDTHVYAFFDTSGSFNSGQLQTIKTSVDSWYQSFRPNDVGMTMLHKKDNSAESWLGFAQLAYDDINNNGKILLLSFVNEADSSYHGLNIVNPTVGQPTDPFQTHYNNFVNNIYPNLDFFAGINYTIATNYMDYVPSKGFIQHVLLAVKGTSYTINEANTIISSLSDTIFDATDKANLLTSMIDTNPYQSLGVPLSTKGWISKVDKNDLAYLTGDPLGSVPVITPEVLANDLNSLLSDILITEEVIHEETYYVKDIIKVDGVVVQPKKITDASWTIAYKIMSDSWVSYYDFKPNYYIGFNDYFLTGYNTNSNPLENGLWGHLLTNRSFGVYNGQKYDWTVEYPLINKFSNKVLEAISYEIENRRYSNTYNYAPILTNGMNKLLIYNFMSNSGNIELISQQRNFSNYRTNEYPKTISNSLQQVLETQENETKFNVNYFFDRVKNPYSGTPHMISDVNDIQKQVNSNAVSFYNRNGINNRLNGNEFMIRLSSNDSQVRKIFKHSINQTV